MIEIKLPFESRLIVTKDLYQIQQKSSTYLASTSLLLVLERYLESLMRSENMGLEAQTLQEIRQLTNELEVKRMHFLGRMAEIIQQLPTECKHELIEEIDEEMRSLGE